MDSVDGGSRRLGNWRLDRQLGSWRLVSIAVERYRFLMVCNVRCNKQKSSKDHRSNECGENKPLHRCDRLCPRACYFAMQDYQIQARIESWGRFRLIEA